jgi:hypothetical protein
VVDEVVLGYIFSVSLTNWHYTNTMGHLNAYLLQTRILRPKNKTKSSEQDKISKRHPSIERHAVLTTNIALYQEHGILFSSSKTKQRNV